VCVHRLQSSSLHSEVKADELAFCCVAIETGETTLKATSHPSILSVIHPLD
jgi:hypothetical protein